MNIATERCAGLTFVSSRRGWRYDRLNQGVLFASIAGWIFVSDYVRFNEVAWDVPVIFLLVWVISSWLMQGADRRRVFGAKVNIREDHLHVVDDGVSLRLSWKDILYIRIDRSPSGHRRKVRIRARGGKLFLLLDPEDGELLESWALEVASARGIKVRVRRWVTLCAEPLWSMLMSGLVVASVQFVNLLDIF